jgi:hypothetical protein
MNSVNFPIVGRTCLRCMSVTTMNVSGGCNYAQSCSNNAQKTMAVFFNASRILWAAATHVAPHIKTVSGLRLTAGQVPLYVSAQCCSHSVVSLVVWLETANVAKIFVTHIECVADCCNVFAVNLNAAKDGEPVKRLQFPINIMYVFLIFPSTAACPAQPIYKVPLLSS